MKFPINGALLLESVRQTVRDIWRAKCTYCIGCCSIFLVVIVAALAQTMVARAPLIFLREAETSVGQIDVTITSNGNAGRLLNYSQFAASIAASPPSLSRPYSYTAGRLSIGGRLYPLAPCAAAFPAPLSALRDWPYVDYAFNASSPTPAQPVDASLCSNYLTCVPGCAALGSIDTLGINAVTTLLINSGREQRAGLGRSWPVAGDGIPPGGVVLSAPLAAALAKAWADVPDASAPAAAASFTPGGQMLLWLPTQEILTALLPAVTAAIGAGAPGSAAALASANAQLLGLTRSYPSTAVPLTVHAVASAAAFKAKFGGGAGDASVVLEADHFLPLLLRSLHPGLRSALVRILQRAGVTPAPAGSASARAFAPLFAAVPAAAGGTGSGSGGGGFGSGGLDIMSDAQTATDAAYTAVLGAATGCPNPATRVVERGLAPAAPPSCMADWFSDTILANLPPATRLTSYANTNYDRLRADVADFASSMLYLAGFTETEADAPILGELEPRRFITLYLGLVLDVLLITLFGLAIILIYSLLLVNAEGKQFEVAVRRMLGSGRPTIITLLLAHAVAHALPAWIFGLVLAQAGTAAVFSYFRKVSDLPVPTTLTPASILVATALAWAIPAIAVVGPVRAALKRNIHDALDPGRPAAGGVKISISQRNSGRVSTTAVVVGVCATVFGFALYYLLPLALLSSNLNLIFNLFLCIIIGMLLGLVILGLNLELLALRGLMWLTVGWWEHGSIVKLLWANLSAAHRTRNRKTAVMYSLAIALIVFIVVAATGQISSASYAARVKAGASVVCNSDSQGTAQQALDEGTLAAYERIVRNLANTGYASGAPPASSNGNGGSSSSAATFGTPVVPAGSAGWLRHAWASTKLEGASAWVAAAAAVADDLSGSALPRSLTTPMFPWQLRLLDEDVGTDPAVFSAASSAGGGALWTTGAVAQRNLGRSGTWTATVRAVSPTFYRGASYPDVLSVETLMPGATLSAAGASSAGSSLLTPSATKLLGSADNGDSAAFSLSDALYTSVGSQGVLASNNIRYEIQARAGGSIALQTSTGGSNALGTAWAGGATSGGGGGGSALANATGFGPAAAGSGTWYARSQSRVLGLLSSSPVFTFSRAPSSADAVLLPLTALPRLLTAHLESVARNALPSVPLSVLASAPHMYGAGPNGTWTLAHCRALLRALGMGSDDTVPGSRSSSGTVGGGSTGAGGTGSDAGSGTAPSFTQEEFAVCMLKALDADTLGLAAREVAYGVGVNASASAAAGGGGGATNITDVIAASLASATGRNTPRVPRYAGGTASVLPISVSDIPLQGSYLPAQDSAALAATGARVGGPLSQMSASKLAGALTKAFYDAAAQVAGVRWFMNGAGSSPGNSVQHGRLQADAYTVTDNTAAAVDMEMTVTLLQLVFAVLALIAMVLCFFSLSASMLTNIREQGREVGVLRALGITRPQTVRLYLHEAVLLVLSASFSGIVIGSITAWTFSMQQQLFTGLPVPFVLPWGVIAVVVIMALVLGIFAAGLPAWRSVKRPITVLLRGQ